MSTTLTEEKKDWHYFAYRNDRKLRNKSEAKFKVSSTSVGDEENASLTTDV